jgi:NADH-quinone oxidoreductase subunit G
LRRNDGTAIPHDDFPSFEEVEQKNKVVVTMATIYIDNHPYEVDSENNLLQTCLSLGFDLPYFCWHPALGSVGACRQCAVKMFKDENDTRGRIYMACMTPVTDGMRISLEDPQVKDFHAQVIEWLMTNHPHDCPVCDEGGECHLQDMTVLSGHNYRRHRFPKRTFRNQNLGPFINHEMNRCITCYRCVRFYNDYAGGTDLQAMASKNHVYFGRHEDGTLENEFSGNLVEVCPTGVFTDKTLKHHYTRKWDMQSAPSICIHCGLGCNTLPSERYGTLSRIQNRFHSEINGYFLCDRGRFGYDFVNSDKRLRHTMCRNGEGVDIIAKNDALKQAAALLQSNNVMGIGSPRASLESNYLLRRLVGAENFYAGVAEQEWRCIQTMRRILDQGPGRTPTLEEVEQADAILILGEDISQTAARLALSVRQALHHASLQQADSLNIPRWQDRAVRDACRGFQTPLFIATPAPTRLDELAASHVRAAPDDIARLGYALAHGLDAKSPVVAGLKPDQAEWVKAITEQLAGAQRPLIIAGSACGSTALIEAAANVARALRSDERTPYLSYTVPECNSLGLALLEPKPLTQLEQGQTLLILENDLYRRAGRERVDALLAHPGHVVVMDHLQTATTERAGLLLPAATFAETSGTLINNEARAQRFFQVLDPAQDEVQGSWRWLAELLHDDLSRDRLLQQMAAEFPALSAVTEAAPAADFRLLGQRIPRESPRYSGRTAMHADQTLHEPKPAVDHETPLAFSMEGYPGEPPAALLPRTWAPHWNSVQALNKFQQEVGGPLRGGDPGVRLLKPSPAEAMPYFDAIPTPFEPRDDQYLVVPLQHLFGSEELSVEAPALAKRVPSAYLGMAESDAEKLGVGNGGKIKLQLDDQNLTLPIAPMPGLPPGLVALPQLPDTGFMDGPRWGRLQRMDHE